MASAGHFSGRGPPVDGSAGRPGDAWRDGQGTPGGDGQGTPGGDGQGTPGGTARGRRLVAGGFGAHGGARWGCGGAPLGGFRSLVLLIKSDGLVD